MTPWPVPDAHAPARMNLQTVTVEVGPGSDNDGAFALRYANLGAGTFSRCAE
ncbi:hypothetical protein [Massilia rubra]|uniref:hypothetical protein n=1 Tax=Massilia rubra TaxID=2607910 RepID=UPI0014246A5E|nr:hypothetical protein [Massilia rubra]